jgi:hypothetical protein
MTKRLDVEKPIKADSSKPSEQLDRAQSAVGFGNPPVRTRFKKGVSGNPSGRPRGSPNAAIGIREAFTAPITIRQGNKIYRASTLEALSRKMLERGIRGDHRAFLTVIKMAKDLGLLVPPAPPEYDLTKLTDEELEHLERLTRKALVEPTANSTQLNIK